MLTRRTISFLVACGCLTMGAGIAAGDMPTGIFSTVSGHSTAVVPGLPASTRFESLDRPFRSPSGNYWIISAEPTDGDEVLIVGTGPTRVGANVVLQEDSLAPWGGPGEDVGSFETDLGINDSGHYAFATNTGGGSSSSDEYIVRWNGSFNVVAQEGQPLPGAYSSEVWGSAMDTPCITNDGRVAFRAPDTKGVLNHDFIFLGDQVVAESQVTVPANQAFAPRAWEGFDRHDFRFDGSGQNYIMKGNVTGITSDDMVVVNNSVALQEDTYFDDIDQPIGSMFAVDMMSGGDWFVRGDVDDDGTGNFNSGQDWIVLNGDIIAKTLDLVPGGLPGERYSDALESHTFFAMTANNNGDHVVGSWTDYIETEFDSVLVLNGQSVVARENDPVDLDGDGVFNDNVFIDAFIEDGLFLTDDMRLYFLADLRNDMGSVVGQAYLSLLVPEPSSMMLLALAGLALVRRR